MPDKPVRLDYKVIESIIEPGSTVMDLGCGDGELLKHLVDKKQVKAQGIEISEEAIYKCVEKGLNVFHSDIDSGLKDYPDRSFDYVILNQSLQEVKKVGYVLDEAFRTATRVIVGFPNFAHIHSRSMLFFKGKSPITEALPNKWHDTPNLRFLSKADFREFCDLKKIKILRSYYLGSYSMIHFFPNLFAVNAIFVIRK
jgi:methionine biosynthesis protein MetW